MEQNFYDSGSTLSQMMISTANATVEATYQSDWGRIMATLIRSFGDFDLAEEAAQEAFAAATIQWPDEGVPDSPAAWIIQTAKHKAIDRLRRQARFQEKVESYALEIDSTTEQPDPFSHQIPDDRLRLIFTCCHPALAPEAQAALTQGIKLRPGSTASNIGIPTKNNSPAYMEARGRIEQALIAAGLPER